MRRRTFLRAVSLGCVTLAGCTQSSGSDASARAPRASLRMKSISPLEIVQRIYGSVEDDDSRRGAVLADATANGTATVRAVDPPLEDGDRTVYDGTLYRVSSTVEDQERAAVYPIVLDDLGYDTVTAAPDDERVAFADLPAVDRRTFRENGLADGDVLGIGTNLVYTDAEAEQSALVPTPEYGIIVWGPDRKGRFSLRGEPYDRTLSTYRYSFETVEESAAAYGRRLRDEHAVDLSDVPDAEAEILRAAIEGEDYEVSPESTPSDPFQSLADRFRSVQDILTLREGEEDRVGDPRNGAYLVRFDETLYWMDMYVRELEPSTQTAE